MQIFYRFLQIYMKAGGKFMASQSAFSITKNSSTSFLLVAKYWYWIYCQPGESTEAADARISRAWVGDILPRGRVEIIRSTERGANVERHFSASRCTILWFLFRGASVHHIAPYRAHRQSDR